MLQFFLEGQTVGDLFDVPGIRAWARISNQENGYLLEMALAGAG